MTGLSKHKKQKGSVLIRAGRKCIAFCSRSSVIFALELLAVLVVIAVLAISVFMWRVTQGPIKLDFAKEYIERSLNTPQSPYRIEFGDVALKWEDLSEPFQLNVQDFEVYSGENLIFATRQIDLVLSRRYLLFGQIHPKEVVVTSPFLRLVRTAARDIKLDIQAPTPQASDEETQNLDKDTDFAKDLIRIISGESLEGQETVFDQLKELRIEKARVIVEDRFLNISWMVPESYLFIRRQDRGAELLGDLYLPDNRGRAHVSFDAFIKTDLSQTDLSAKIENLSLKTIAQKLYPEPYLMRHKIPLNAHLKASLNKDLILQSAYFKADSEAGSLDLPLLYDEEITYENLETELSYSAADGIVDFKSLTLNLQDQDFSLSSKLKLDEGIAKGPVMLKVEETSIAKARDLFPDKIKDDDIRKWIFEKIKKANITSLLAKSDLTVAYDKPGELKSPEKEENKRDDKDRDVIENTILEFDFKDLDLDYAPPFLPVTQVSGAFKMQGEKITVESNQGKLGALDIEKANIAVTKVFTPNTGNVDIKGDLSGPLTGILDFLEVDTLAQRINYQFQPNKVKGDVDLGLHVHFPTGDEIPFENVGYDINGQVHRAFWPDAFADMPLKGGPYNLRVTQDDIELKLLESGYIGPAQADQLHWHEYFSSPPKGTDYTTLISGKVQTNAKFREQIGLGLEDFISGPLPASFTYRSQENGKAIARVEGNIKTTDIIIPQIGYKKEPDSGDILSLNAEFFGGKLQKISQISINSPDFVIAGGELSFIQKNAEPSLSSGVFSGLVIGENDVEKLEFQITPSDVFKLTAQGSFLNGRWFIGQDPFAQEKAEPAPDMISVPEDGQNTTNLLPEAKIVSVQFDRVRTDPARLIENVTLYTQTDRQGDISQLEMDAKAGQGDIYLRYKPDQSGKKFFRLQLTDTGAALKSFNLYDNLEGGLATVVAEPVAKEGPGNFKGRFIVKDFQVQKAPVLAKLVSALSVSGLTQLFENKGIQFSRLAGHFNWSYQEEGAKIELRKGRTSGNSLGLTFEGFINLATDKVDVNGTIIPLSGINSFISNIPVLGNIFAGSEGAGIFAATYTIKGAMQAPEVAVNPLAVLAPGFVRDILFEGNEDETDLPSPPEKGTNPIQAEENGQDNAQ